ncbi:MAG: cyclic nucleotide-binding domain-containing protein, partial [Bdellovibrio sp.]
MEYDRGFEFLTQGDVNDCLYFLKSGSVEVIVDKEKVTTLSDSGEVFGEMSVLSGRHVSASVRCASVCHVYVINPKDFSHALPKDRDRFLFLLHKIYSVVVSERLIQTNDKAKQFETANRELDQIRTELENTNLGLEAAVEERTRELRFKAEELENSRTKLEQQNAALIASIRKVSDLSEIKDKTLEKIRVLSSDILLPLKKNIASLEIADPERKATLDLALRGLEEFESFIKPLTDLYQAEKA